MSLTLPLLQEFPYFIAQGRLIANEKNASFHDFGFIYRWQKLYWVKKCCNTCAGFFI